MKNTEKKSFSYSLRSLHRDIGFFIIGLTVVYSLSGIILIYRDTDFLKRETKVEKKIAPNIDESELGEILHMRDFKVLKNEGDIIYFKNGTYNKATGETKYTEKVLPPLLNKLTSLHKSSSRSLTHWFATIFGVLLLFMAISSFWMLKAKSKTFRRGIYLASLGVLFTLILLFL